MSTEDTQTLKDALNASGDASQVNLLTPEAQNLTKSQITDMMNGENLDHLTMGTMNSLKALVTERMKNGQSVWPWTSMPAVKAGGGGMGGGFW